MRQRCYRCFRPLPLCFCEAVPRIDNRTDVLILQHVGERYHPFNTARIVRNALQRCHLIADHNQCLGSHYLPIQPDAGLLYPKANAPTLSEIPPIERPSQLVVIDGTWHQAKTIVRDVPQLCDLPCYRLTPSSPGQYRIRREPDEQSLSTLEATVAALRALEPDTHGWDQLLSAFHEMVEQQLSHPANRRSMWRRKKASQSRPRHIPRALLQDPNKLVVAYGETTPGQQGQRNASPSPLNWMAQRLGSGERFSCCLQHHSPISPAAMDYMRLTEQDFDAAISHEDFRHQWSRFVRRNDVLIVYHQKTFQLLRNVGAAQTRCLALKAIFGRWQESFRSPEELMKLEEVSFPDPAGKNRASLRLEMAVALVEHLRTRFGYPKNDDV